VESNIFFEVADILEARGFSATVEYPGNIFMFLADGTKRIWGTANGTWEGDVPGTDDWSVARTLETGIVASCGDAEKIASAIISAMEES
jgi:hypothetical protein